MDVESYRNLAAVAAAAFGVGAAVCAQLTYQQGELSKPPRYFGGAAMTPDVSEKGIRADAYRERAGLRADLFQSTATAFVVCTTLVGLYAGLGTNVTTAVCILGLTIGIGQPILALRRWWPEDRRIIAKTEYYVEMQHGLKMFPVEEQRRQFSERHPELSRWL